jgi:O-antigen ligase
MRAKVLRNRKSGNEKLASTLGEHLNSAIYVLVLCCVLIVSFAVSFQTHHPFAPVKETLFHLFALLVCFLLLVRSTLTNTLPIGKNPLHVLVLLYLVYNAFSFALFPYSDKIYFVDLTLLTVFFFAVAHSVNSETKYGYFLDALILIVVVSSVYGFLQFFGYEFGSFGEDSFGERGLGIRVFSFFGNPNFFASVLITSLPLLLTGFFTKQGARKSFFGISIVLGIVSLGLTGTRAAMAAFAVSILLFFVLTYTGRKRIYFWATGMTLILLTAGFLYSLKVTVTGFEGLQFRQRLWQGALDIAQDHPLFGTGVGSFAVYFPAYSKKSDTLAWGGDSHERTDPHAHNEFLEILSDLGIPGFLLFAGILFAFLHNYYAIWNPEKKYLIAGNCCAVIAILAQSLYSVNLRFLFIAMFLWLCLGLQSALMDQPRAAAKATFSAGKIIACLLPLPLFVTFFFTHSLARYSVEYHLKNGLVFYANKDYRQAKENYKKALESNPEHRWTLYFIGVSEYRLEQFAQSKETMLKLIQIDPNFLQSHYWLANCYYMLEDYENAKKEFRRSLKVNNIYGPSHYGLGLIALLEGKSQKALNSFERAYTLEGDPTTELNRLKALERLIEINESLENWDKARFYTHKLRELEERRDYHGEGPGKLQLKESRIL